MLRYNRVTATITALIAVAAAALQLAPALASDSSHLVEPGDSLSAIADHYGIDLDLIVEANAIENPDHIQVGDLIVIPEQLAATEVERPAPPEPLMILKDYTVAPGDSLSGIADSFGLTIDDLLVHNDIVDPNHIRIGSVLLIPAPAAETVHPEAVHDLIVAASQEFGVRSALLLGLAWQESGWQQHLVSSSGAVGIMQLMPETAEWVEVYLLQTDVDWENDPQSNIRAGAAMMRHLLNLADGDEAVAVAAYYQGWFAVTAHGFFQETVEYVDNVLSLAATFE